jgi:succinate-semialdehyde dehydrogenase/glutarate-semialdehyde dehydrogenase
MSGSGGGRLERHLLYLDGKFVDTGQARSVVNPATGQPFAEVAVVAGRGEVARAIERAHAAFATWRATPAKARADKLLAIAARLEARKDEVARAVTLESGKPLAQGHAEVAMSIDHVRWFAEEGRRAYGRLVPNQVEGKRHLVMKSPIGVVGAISPWNFPLVLGVRKLAPALAAGCPVVLKPALQTPISTLLFARCAQEADLPAGVLQIVCGNASEIGAEFLENAAVRKITFTGSTEVGRLLIAGAAARVVPLSLELGGNAPLLVFDDARLERAVEGALVAKFRNTGQSCIAANRFYVQRGIAGRFIEAFVARVRALKVGDGLEPGVDVGPLIDQRGVDKALDLIRDAVARGARVLCGGNAMTGRPGTFVEPTVLVDVPHEARILHEEVFAPVTPIVTFDHEAEAIERANAEPFGLAGYVFSQDLDRAYRVCEALEAGSIGLNDGVPTTSNCPFGGFKQSGWGRELGVEGLEAFLETKHVAMALSGA